MYTFVINIFLLIAVTGIFEVSFPNSIQCEYIVSMLRTQTEMCTHNIRDNIHTFTCTFYECEHLFMHVVYFPFSSVIKRVLAAGRSKLKMEKDRFLKRLCQR